MISSPSEFSIKFEYCTKRMLNRSYHISHVLQLSGCDYQWAHAHSWECWWDWCGHCIAYCEWWQRHTEKALLLRAGCPQGNDHGQKGQLFLLKACLGILKHGVPTQLDCKILVVPIDLDCSSSTSRSCVLSVSSSRHQIVSTIQPNSFPTKTFFQQKHLAYPEGLFSTHIWCPAQYGKGSWCL